MRILLTSDLHLGIDERAAAAPGHARINTFRKICAIAADHDLFLIAGDLFHGGESNAVAPAVTGIVSQELAALRQKGVEILYTPGECDRALLEAGGPVSNDCFTHVFSSGDGSGFSITRGNETVSVYGISSVPRSTVSVHRREKGGFHIALLHGDFCADDVGHNHEVPRLGRDEIRSLNLDFFALGHNHNFRIFKSRNRVIGAYPGSPEAVGPSETGERYVLSITVENGEIIQIKRLAVNTVTVDRIVIPCEGIHSSGEIAGIVEKNATPGTALTVILSGDRAFPLDLQAVMQCARGFERLEIVDESSPDLAILAGEYTGENSLRGAFFERLREMIERNEIPGDIDRRLLARMVGRMAATGEGRLEDWHCV